ncbi:GNAT family N-acetyltransferase [Wenxinia marina]|uniref:Putative acetyltransferase n=1 Tax=Wenxinia marina DSM 24838 TaxID=1123501 RepID=A0A0D0Q643_9RHOB|nr:N-acetyltransferase [Wenxinia marina]KIQ67942.1 putative acetyltransferase [Wenxinia marina DSM 24838]GGL76048.1 N-acetyltransferase [Wenxinia marina]
MGQGDAYRLAEEAPADWWEVEALYDTCFAPGRTALSSYRLRDGVAPVGPLCLTARDGEGVLAGAIRVWPAQVGSRPVLLVGPVAVHPTRQGEGLGALLIFRSMQAARRLFWPRAMLVGDYPYYRRFGFRRLEGVEMPPPTNPERVLGIELAPGGWVGVTGAVTKWGSAGIAVPAARPAPRPD